VTAEQPCSDAARARGDRWVGTAPPARRWFLVTQATDWGSTAWQGLAAAAPVKARLEEILSAAGARLMLIRRPGRSHGDEPARWATVDETAVPRVRWGLRRSDDDLVEAARTLLGHSLAADPSPLHHEPGERILLVCTHGRHDRCCAVRGRPVAAAAAELWPEATWECTHTGGDRFAANLVVLPDGACYGGLDPADVEPVLRAHLAGRVDPTHLRGPTGRTPAAQAAVVAAHQHWGPLDWSAVEVHGQTGDRQHWTVALGVAGLGSVRATGHTELSPPRRLTCNATGPATMAVPIVDRLEPVGPGPGPGH